MSDDVLVKVDNVSKRFCRSLKRSLWYGLQDLGSEIGGRRHGGGSGLPQSSADVQLRPDEFWAVKDVSFELRRGECLGLIGRNGAGKTTLLRMLNGLIKPDTGSIQMNGETGAIIALGAGFNPLLTGRENIYISCSVLGLKDSRTRRVLDDIIDFADIGSFIDMPVQNYSSGMQVRLGFAIATATTPDILILDEVLAVGDLAFRKKCYERLGRIKESTATIIVSHDQSQLSHACSHGLLLSKTQRQKRISGIEEALTLYNQELDHSSNSKQHLDTSINNEICLSAAIEPHHLNVTNGEKLEINVSINIKQRYTTTIPRVFIRDKFNDIVAEWKNPSPLALNAGANNLRLTWDPCLLQGGEYTLDINLYKEDGLASIATITSYNGIIVEGLGATTCPVLIGKVTIR